MTTWPVHDAKARFSEMLNRCLAEGPQVVTRRGAEAAVLVPVADWQRLMALDHPTLKDWLMADFARMDIPVPDRDPSRRRSVPSFDD